MNRKQITPIAFSIIFATTPACGFRAEREVEANALPQELLEQVDIVVPDGDLDAAASAAELARTLKPVIDRGARSEGLPTVRLLYLGKGSSTEGVGEPRGVEDEEKDARRNGANDAGKSPAAPGDWDVFLPERQHVFRVSLGEERMVRLAADVSEGGLDRPFPQGVSDPEGPEDGLDDPAVPKGWSNNADNRADLVAQNTGPVTHSTYRKIGQMGTGCTGQLVGPRHVLTAAHCVQTFGTSTYFNFTIRMGRNLTFWNAASSTNSSPVWTPAGWTNGTAPSARYDIAIVVIPDRLGDTQGWFGYAKATDARLGQLTKYRRGYPTCNGIQNGMARIDDPADPTPAANSTSNLTVCQDSNLYGVSLALAVGNFANSATWGGETFKLTVDHNSDASLGDSGSAIYFVGDGQTGTVSGETYIAALESQWICGGFATSTQCTSATAYASRDVRIGSEYYAQIASLRTSYP